MFDLVRATKIFGDETAGYSVILDKPYTVKEFVDTVISERPKEWGYVGIKNKNSRSFFGDPRCEYRWGKLLSALPNDYLNKSIKEVSASGGWSRMDYLLTV